MQSIFKDLEFLNTAPLCHTLKQLGCLNSMLLQYVKIDFCPLKVKPGCVAVEYDYFIHRSKMLPDILNVLDPKTYRTSRNRSDWDVMKKNLMLVNVYMKDKFETFMVDTQTITVSDLVMNFGSTVGVMLGMSFTTIFEVSFQFFIYLGQKCVEWFYNESQYVKWKKRASKTKVNKITSITVAPKYP